MAEETRHPQAESAPDESSRASSEMIDEIKQLEAALRGKLAVDSHTIRSRISHLESVLKERGHL